MDAYRFDTLARSLTGTRSRRAALVAALGGMLGVLSVAETKAKKKKACPPCTKRKKGKCKAALPNGTACAGGTCQGGSCVSAPPPCMPEPAATTCVAGCGPRINNCNQRVTCPCPSGLTCLLNGTCARVCTGPIGEGCDGCTPTSTCFLPNSEGQRLCAIPEQQCVTLQPCDSVGTAGCPQGFACYPGCGCVALGVCPPI